MIGEDMMNEVYHTHSLQTTLYYLAVHNETETKAILNKGININQQNHTPELKSCNILQK